MFETHVRPVLLTTGAASEVSCDLEVAHGEPRPVLLTARLDPDASPGAAITHVFYGATERSAYERRHRDTAREAEQLAAIVTGSEDGYLTVCSAGKIVTANEGANAILRRQDLVGAPAREVLPKLADWLADFEDAEARRAVHQLRWRSPDGPRRDLHVTLATLGGDDPLALAGAATVSVLIRDVTASATTRRHLTSTVAVLNHRVKNTLAVVQSVVSQSFAGVEGIEGHINALSKRLRTIADAHDVLTARGWRDSDLGELLARILAPAGGTPQTRLEGPPVSLRTEDTIMLALAFRELAEHSAAHGALSVPAGTVDLSWRLAEGGVRLVWQEAGGPPPVVPTGFAHLMLTRVLPAQLTATYELETGDQLRYEIDLFDRPSVRHFGEDDAPV